MFSRLIAALICLAIGGYAISRVLEVERRAEREKVLTVVVLSSSLKMDWFAGNSTNPAEPDYTLTLELQSSDGQTLRYEGPPGEAYYPEEALDEFHRFAKGTTHRIAFDTGRTRQIRLYDVSSALDFGAYVGNVSLACLGGLNGLAFAWMAWRRYREQPTMLGWWTVVFCAFVALLVLSVLAVGRNLNTLKGYQPVTLQLGEARRGYTPENLPPEVTVSPALIEGLQGREYRLYRYEYGGRTYWLANGIGSEGVLDSSLSFRHENPDAIHNTHVWPENRWNLRNNVSPVGALLLPVAFLGSGCLILLIFAFVGYRSLRKIKSMPVAVEHRPDR